MKSLFWLFGKEIVAPNGYVDVPVVVSSLM